MTNNEWVLSRKELAFKLYKAYAHSGSPSFYIEHWLRVADAALGVEQAGSTPAKPERVRKTGGQYEADGTVVARFKTLAGKERIIFEFDNPAGMLHIFDPAQVRGIE